MSPVPCQDIVPSCAGQKNLNAMIPGELGDEVDINGGKVGLWFVQVPDHALQVFNQFLVYHFL